MVNPIRVLTISVGTAVTAPILVYGGFLLGGISMSGPIAGGLFASKMGAGLVAGSLLSGIQSVAMSTSTYAVSSSIGAVAGCIAGLL
jgi:hypothetical protein